MRWTYLVHSLKSSLHGLCSSLSRHPATTSWGMSGRCAADLRVREKRTDSEASGQTGGQKQNEMMVCCVCRLSRLRKQIKHLSVGSPPSTGETVQSAEQGIMLRRRSNLAGQVELRTNSGSSLRLVRFLQGWERAENSSED